MLHIIPHFWYFRHLYFKVFISHLGLYGLISILVLTIRATNWLRKFPECDIIYIIMSIPRPYKENLKNGIITTSMLKNCLFSLNKRVQNCFAAIKYCEPVHWQNCTDKWKFITDNKNKIRKCNSARGALLLFLISHCTDDNYGRPPALELAENFVTYKPCAYDLISLNFISKVVELLKSGTLELVDDANNENDGAAINKEARSLACAA